MADATAVNENATIAAVGIASGILAADKLGMKRAKKLKQEMTQKAEEWQEWKRRHPRLVLFYGYFDSISTAAIQYTDLLTDILAVMYFIQHRKIWYAFWMVCFIFLPFFVASFSIGNYVRQTYGYTGKFLGCFNFYTLLPFLICPVLPPLIDVAFPLLLLAGQYYSEFSIFLTSYSAVSTLSQALFEALPQTVLQGWIVWHCGDGSCGIEVEQGSAIWRSLVVSFLNIAKQLIGVYFTSKAMGISLPEYLRSLIQLGKGLPLQSLKKNDPYFKTLSFPDRVHSHPLSPEEIKLLTELLKTNTSVRNVDFAHLGVNEEGCIRIAKVFGYKTEDEQNKELENDKQAIIDEATLSNVVKRVACCCSKQQNKTEPTRDNLPLYSKQNKQTVKPAAETIELEKPKTVYNKSITSLNLTGCMIGTQGALALSHVLRQHDDIKLTKLLLSDNSVIDTSDTNEIRSEKGGKKDEKSKCKISTLYSCFKCRKSAGTRPHEKLKKDRRTEERKTSKSKTKTKPKSKAKKQPNMTSVLPRTSSFILDDSMKSEEEQIDEVVQTGDASRRLSKQKLSYQYNNSREKLKKRLQARKKNALKILDQGNTIRKIACFKHMKKYEVDQMMKVMKHHIFQDKRVICEAGKPAFSFYIIISGTVQVRVPLNGRLSEVRRLGPLSSFGGTCLVDSNQTRTATCTAIGNVEALTLDREDFQALRVNGILDHITEKILTEEAEKYKKEDLKRKISKKMESILFDRQQSSRLRSIIDLKSPKYMNLRKKRLLELRQQKDNYDLKEIGKRNEVNKLVSSFEVEEEIHQLNLDDSQDKGHKHLLDRLNQRQKKQDEHRKQMIRDHAKDLRKIDCFSDKHISKDDFHRLLGAFRVETFSDGDIICRYNDIANDFYVILDGHVKVFCKYKSKSAIREMTSIDEEHSSSHPYFGETALINQGIARRTATCIAKTTKENGKVVLMALNRYQYDSCLRQSARTRRKSWFGSSLNLKTSVDRELKSTFDAYMQNEAKMYSICNEAAISFGKTIFKTTCMLTHLELHNNRIDEDGKLALAELIGSAEHCSLRKLNLSGYPIPINKILNGKDDLDFGEVIVNKDLIREWQVQSNLKQSEKKGRKCKIVGLCKKSQNVAPVEKVRRMTIVDLKVVLVLLNSSKALCSGRKIDFSSLETKGPADDDSKDKNSTVEKLLAKWLVELKQQSLKKRLGLEVLDFKKLHFVMDKLNFHNCIRLSDVVLQVNSNTKKSIAKHGSGTSQESQSISAPKLDELHLGDEYNGHVGELLLLSIKDWEDLASIHISIKKFDSKITVRYSESGEFQLSTNDDRDMQNYYYEELRDVVINGAGGQLALFKDLFCKEGKSSTNEINFPLEDVDYEYNSNAEKAEKLADIFDSSNSQITEISKIIFDKYEFCPKQLMNSTSLGPFDEELSTGDVIILGAMMRGSDCLEKLDLSGNSRIYDGASHFIAPLMEKITELDLSGTSVGNDTLKEIASKLVGSKTVKRFYAKKLLQSSINLDCAMEFVRVLKSNIVLEELDIDWDIFTLDMLTEIFKTNHKALPIEFTLRSDLFRFHPQDENKLCEALKSFYRLEQLTLGNRKDSYPINLRKLAKDTKFECKNHFLTDSDVIIVCNMIKHRNLTELDLSNHPDIGAYCGESIIALIDRSENLLSLNLSETGVQDSTIVEIANLLKKKATVENIILNPCYKLRDTGGIAIHDAVRDKRNLRKLDIDWRSLSADVICNFISLNSPAISSKLEFYNIDPAGALKIGSALTKNNYAKSIFVNGNNYEICPDILRNLECLQSEVGSKLRNEDIIIVVQYLKISNSCLKGVRLEGNGITDGIGNIINQLFETSSTTCSSILKMELLDTKVGNSFAKSICSTLIESPHNNLQQLTVKNSSIENEGIKYFIDLVKSDNCKFKFGQLQLDFDRCTAKVMREFIEINHPCLPPDIKLAVQSIQEARQIAQSVKVNDHIKTIAVHQYKHPLQNLRTSDSIMLKKEAGVDLCKFDFALLAVLLIDNKDIMTVDLRDTFEPFAVGTSLGHEAVEITEFLCDLLRSKLKVNNFTLKLKWDFLDVECILPLFKTNHPCLPTELDISRCKPEMKLETFEEFSDLLINNKTLQYLKVHEVYISLKAFGKAKKINFADKRSGKLLLVEDTKFPKYDKSLGSKLQSLDIVLITKKLKKNDNIEEFHLVDANLKANAIKTFTDIISTKRKLQFVQMEGCAITDKSCEQLSSMLKSCPKLYTLDLSRNEITTEGALKLVQAAVKKGTYNYPCTVYLNGNKIGRDFANGLVKVFRENKNKRVKIFFRDQKSKESKKLVSSMDSKLRKENIAELFPPNSIFYKRSNKMF